ncbi:MAG: hypothetical protein ACJA0H_000034 [Francisellaceae bacterium]|jgi:uncharacterized protein involved in outer membrane biogenesis
MGIVSSSVSSLLGRNFNAKGLSFGYNSTYGFSVYIHNAELENPKWAKEPQMFSLDDAAISLSLSNLMAGTIKLTNIVAENVSIDVIDKSGGEKNYIFFNENENSVVNEKSSKDSPKKEIEVDQKPDNQESNSEIFIPEILLHNVKITYQNDNRSEYIHIHQLSLKDQTLGHNHLNVDLIVNDVPYILIGDTGNINNLFDNNGFDVKLRVTSDVNSFNTNANISMGDTFQISLGTILKIKNIPSFLQTINGRQVPEWALDFKELNVSSNLIYQNNFLDNLTFDVNGNYKNKNIELKVNAKSTNTKFLYPLNAKIIIKDDTEQIFSLTTKVKKPYSQDKWLSMQIHGNIPNLTYVVNQNIPLTNITLNGDITIVGDEIKIESFKLAADLKDKPVTANLWIDADIKPSQPIKTKVIANVDYQEQMVLGLNANAVFLSNNNDEWLQLKASGAVSQLSELFKIFNINLPYQLTDFEYIIKAIGDRPDHIKIVVDPVNINVNEQPVLSHASAEIDFKALVTTMKLKTIINDDTNSNVTLSGLISSPTEKGKWADIKLSTIIYKGSDLDFLSPKEPQKFDNINEINTDINFQANNGSIDLTVLPSVINLNGHDLRYQSHIHYGLYLAKQPLEIKLNATSGELDKLQISGQGNIKSGEEFNLKAEGNINDLSYYSPLLPVVTEIKINSDLLIKDSIIHLKELKIIGSSNERNAEIGFSSEIDLLKSEITKLNLVSDVAGLGANLNLSGTYQPLDIKGRLSLKAKSLIGVNQFIGGWEIGVVPVLKDLDLSLAYNFVKNNYYTDITYLASGTDLKAKVDISLDKDDSHYKANFKSNIFDLRAIKLAIDQARKEQGIYVSKVDRGKRIKIIKDNSDTPEAAKVVEKKAAKALNKKSTTPSWMDEDISTFLDLYVVDLNLTIDKLIFKNNTAKKISVQLQNNLVSGHTKVGITADKLFGTKVKSIFNLNKVEKIYHLKTNTYIDALNMEQLGSAVPALNGIQKGLLMLNMYGESEGKTPNQLVRALNGKLKLGVDDLQQKLANPSGSIGKLLLLLAGGDWRSGISLKCAIGNFDIVKGDYKINTLMIDTTGAIIQGSGEIDLPGQKVNIVLNPEAKYINLTSLSTAFRVVGDFNNIYVFPDVYSTAKTAATVVGATALAATGIGLIAVGAAFASQGVYYANKNFCADSLKPLSEQEIKKIQKHNEGIMHNLLDDSNNIIGDTYSGTVNTVNTGTDIIKQGVTGSSDLISGAFSGTVDAGSSFFKSGYDMFSGDSSADSGSTEIKNEK